MVRLLRIVCLLLIASASLHAADRNPPMAPQFRHWVDQEVPYILETEERKQFLSLHSDAERESFIKAFWDARNPDLHSDTNTYKDEHYRRLAYANQHFGSIDAQDGWRSDQGHIYITLGEPQQRTTYPAARNVRPLVIWFYESPTPALPTHFYVVFYKRSAGDPYTLYSPYQDGPSRLTTGLEDLNVQQKSLQTIRKSLGDEVARTTVSLIPTEPVDLNDYSPSMSSDVLLSTIKGLPDNPLTKELIDSRRGRELVSTRMLLTSKQAEIEPATFREADGRQTTSFLFLPERSIGGLIGPLPGDKTGYSLALHTVVTTDAGKRVYQAENALSGEMSEDQAAATRKKKFAVEERLPLTPGAYKISSTLTNNITHVSIQESQTLLVPDLADIGWSLSPLLAFTQRAPGRLEGKLPFTIAGVRFIPLAVGDVSLHPSEPLWLAFQLWTKPQGAAPSKAPAQGTHQARFTYSYGRLQGGQAPVSETEEVDTSNVDASGNLLTGHMIPTTGLEPGAYRLVVTALDQDTQRKAYATMTLHIVPWSEPTELWTASTPDPSGNRIDAIDDYKRGLSAIAQAHDDVAATWLGRSLADDPKFLPALDGLVDVLTRSNRFAEVAALSSEHPVTDQLKERTAILMAEANGHVGRAEAGTHILEAELQFQPPNPDLYLALAKLYETGGERSKAEEFKRRAAALRN